MNPYPPKIWVASRELSIAALEEVSLAIAASFLNGSPAAIRAAAWYQASRALWARVSMSAILNCSAWNLPMGPPKAFLSRTYATDSSTQPWASPVDSAATATRPSSSAARNWAYPRPRSPSRFASGTRQPSNDSSCVSDAAQPTLEYFFATVRPGVPDGTRIVEISGLLSLVVPVIAATAITPVMSVPELVMNDLLPSMTQCPSSRRAFVRMAPATSVPPPGSVSPNAASISPAHRAGSHSRLCASVPYR